MTTEQLNEILEKHEKWLNNASDGARAYLRRANLSGADLCRADLRGAELFKATLPLWCGGINIKMGRPQMAQLAYHFCSMQCDDSEVQSLQQSLYKFANEFADSRNDLRDKKYKVGD